MPRHISFNSTVGRNAVSHLPDLGNLIETRFETNGRERWADPGDGRTNQPINFEIYRFKGWNEFAVFISFLALLSGWVRDLSCRVWKTEILQNDTAPMTIIQIICSILRFNVSASSYSVFTCNCASFSFSCIHSVSFPTTISQTFPLTSSSISPKWFFLVRCSLYSSLPSFVAWPLSCKIQMKLNSINWISYRFFRFDYFYARTQQKHKSYYVLQLFRIAVRWWLCTQSYGMVVFPFGARLSKLLRYWTN